ncbi:LytS/YhcK type 5TM receptor domain-containing protein [Fusibacter bizertensis]
MILQLSFGLLERLGLIVIFAFVMSKTMFFKKYVVSESQSVFEKILYGVFWGLLGILMTLLGTPVSGGVANSRTIPVLLSGIIGGPFVGVISGLVAGLHRMFFYQGGDLTAFSCGVSTIIAGIIGGLSKQSLDLKKNKYFYGFLLGIIVEVIQMILILLLAKPFDQAYALVKIIFLPMTFLNALGIGMFLLFIQQIYDENENASARMAHLSLQIANGTLQFLRKGLNEESANAVAQIIYKLTDYDAVAITNDHQILAHIGIGEDHHIVGGHIWTVKTRAAIERGEIQFGQNKSEIGCSEVQCKLRSVIVVPLNVNEKAIGTLKIYRIRENAVLKTDIELVRGLGNLFSTQLELGIVEKQKSLRAKAELNALRAQIKPHFLFNALNAIMSLTRTDAEKARLLLQELSVVLRNGFKNNEPFIPLNEELRFIEAYLNIEKARFPDKLKVEMHVDSGIELMLPPLILQPLVENAIKHGIQQKQGIGTLKLYIRQLDGEVQFIVSDDGIGMMASHKLSDHSEAEKNKGIGLSNVKERLASIYNRELAIETSRDKGTTIEFTIPNHPVRLV